MRTTKTKIIVIKTYKNTNIPKDKINRITMDPLVNVLLAIDKAHTAQQRVQFWTAVEAYLG